jgi:DNA repair protein SbcC/Rad50
VIPLRLSLENFLSYGSPPPLDLTEVEVACLSGPNGAGKSALLDAITWACWGQARGCEGGQNQDRLIREGSDETAVDLTFDLGGSVYRIVRRRARGKKSSLQFMVRGEDDWTNLAGETLRETDAKIAAVLRMDYRTFVASALFLQGRSEDLLARMRPEERKEIFASLLGLGIYERLEGAARMGAREAEAERKAAEEVAERLAEQAGRTEGIGKELVALRKDLEEAAQVEDKLALALEGKREVLSGMEKGEAALSAESETLAAAEKRVAAAQADLAKVQRELEAIDRVLTNDPGLGVARHHSLGG